MEKMVEKKFISPKEIQERYHVSPATLWRWVRDQKFPKPVKLGGTSKKAWVAEELEKWEELLIESR